MRIRVLRLLTVFATLIAVASPAAALAVQRGGVDRGVVQSVDASHIVLRALDGSFVTFEVTPKTRVTLNGSAASLADVKAGYVADVVADGKGRAVVVSAFRAPVVVTVVYERGVVTAVTRSSITVSTDGGPRAVVLDRNTRFRYQGTPARRNAVRPGAVVVITHASDGPAQVVNVLKRARA